MATNTNTTTLQFKSYKGGERRSTDGGYRVVKIDADVWSAQVRVDGKWETLGGGATSTDAELVADTYHTAPVVGGADESHAPTFVQETGDADVAAVLASVPDADTEAEVAEAKAQGVVDDAAALVAQTDAKAAGKAQAQAKRAAKAADKAPAAPGATLHFEALKGDDDDLRAKGNRHAYRVVHAESGGFYASQRTCSWTNIAGKCDTLEQAKDLAQRYENGARQLSHRQFTGLPYAKAIAKLEAN